MVYFPCVFTTQKMDIFSKVLDKVLEKVVSSVGLHTCKQASLRTLILRGFIVVPIYMGTEIFGNTPAFEREQA